MSAPVPLNAPDIELTRGGILAAASVVIATCSVGVTLAVAGGGGGTDQPAAASGPRFATGITTSGTVETASRTPQASTTTV